MWSVAQYIQVNQPRHGSDQDITLRILLVWEARNDLARMKMSGGDPAAIDHAQQIIGPQIALIEHNQTLALSTPESTPPPPRPANLNVTDGDWARAWAIARTADFSSWSISRWWQAELTEPDSEIDYVIGVLTDLKSAVAGAGHIAAGIGSVVQTIGNAATEHPALVLAGIGAFMLILNAWRR